MHATFFDCPSNGSHALPPTAQTVAQVVAQSVAPPMEQSVAPPMEQSVAYRRHDMVGAVGAGELPPDAQCPHLAACPPAHRARGGIHAPRRKEHLEHRLSRASTTKSRYITNTFCPSIPVSRRGSGAACTYKNWWGRRNASPHQLWCIVSIQIARATLSDFRHLVHTFRRLGVPLTRARTRWMFGFHRRLVRTCECDTLLPKPGPLPHTSQTAATMFSSVCLPVQSLAPRGRGKRILRCLNRRQP